MASGPLPFVLTARAIITILMWIMYKFGIIKNNPSLFNKFIRMGEVE